MTFYSFTNGTTADADEVNSNFSFNRFIIFNNIIHAWQTDDFSSDNSQTKTNLVYNTTLDEYSSISDSTSTVLELAEHGVNTDNDTSVPSMQLLNQGVVKFRYELFTLVDECNDSSIDTNLWTLTTGGGGAESKSEDTQKWQNQRSGITNSAMWAECVTDATNGNFYGDKHICLRFYCRSTGYGLAGTASASYSINIYDGSTNVVIASGSNSGAGTQTVTFDKRIDLFFDTSLDQVRVFYDGAEDGSSPFDLSGLSGNVWRLRFRNDADGITGGNSSCNTLMYYLREYKQSGSYSTTVSEALSTDGGSNYTDAVSGFVNTIGNADRENFTGKLYCTLAADEGIAIKGALVGAWSKGYHWDNP